MSSDDAQPLSQLGGLCTFRHAELAKLYEKKGPTARDLWATLDRQTRRALFESLKWDAPIPRHHLDGSSAWYFGFMPEVNFKGLTEPSKNVLFDIIEFRATSSLVHQLHNGCGSTTSGDILFVQKWLEELEWEGPLKYCQDQYLSFTEESYGEPSEQGPSAQLDSQSARRCCLPMRDGIYAMYRQHAILGFLCSIFRMLVDNEETIRQGILATPAQRGKFRIDDARDRIETLLLLAHEQSEFWSPVLAVYTSVPELLVEETQGWAATDPVLVLNKHGTTARFNPFSVVKTAIWQALCRPLELEAVWTYTEFLLLLVLESRDHHKAYDAVLYQELSNVVGLHVSLARDIFKRQVMLHIASDHFIRVESSVDGAADRILIRGDPEELTRKDAQLHYVLRLCQPETYPDDAYDILCKLDDLHEQYPAEKDRMCWEEHYALMELRQAISLHRGAVRNTPVSQRKGQRFLGRWNVLNKRLCEVQADLDLGEERCWPIQRLLVDDKAKTIVGRVQDFVKDRTGKNMQELYRAVAWEALQDVTHTLKEQLQAKAEQAAQGRLSAPLFQKPHPEPQKPLRKKKNKKKQKKKTRPATTWMNELGGLFDDFDLEYQPEAPDADDELAILPSDAPPRRLQVSSAGAEVFHTLFERSSRPRGSLAWTAFEAAMVELGFSVKPAGGSAYIFAPPESMGAVRPFTIHRPHSPSFRRITCYVCRCPTQGAVRVGRGHV